MNRVPVHEVFEQRPVDSGPRAGDECTVFRPLDGDECTVELTDVRVSPAGGCAHSAVFGGAGDGTTSSTVVVMVLGEADCAADRALEAVLSGMAAGEAREFRLGDGRGGCAAGRARLAAVRRRRAGAGWRDDDRRKLAEAARHKDAGNGLYRRARYADAFHRFNRAVRAVLFVRDEAGARDQRDALYAAVCNNMAACQLHMANYEHARRLSDKALSVDPDNVKALVRRCRASAELGLYDEALADADRALSRDPGNATARRYRDAAARGVLRQDGLYRDMVKRMFAG